MIPERHKYQLSFKGTMNPEVFEELLSVTRPYRDRDEGDIPFNEWDRGVWSVHKSIDSWEEFRGCRPTIFNDGSRPTISIFDSNGHEITTWGNNDLRDEDNRIIKSGSDVLFDRQQYKLCNLYDTMGKLLDQLEKTKLHLLEERLRPPEQGGSLYEKAKTRYSHQRQQRHKPLQ